MPDVLRRRCVRLLLHPQAHVILWRARLCKMLEAVSCVVMLVTTAPADEHVSSAVVSGVTACRVC